MCAALCARPEIGVAQRRIGAQFGRLPLHDLAAKLQHIGSIGELQRFVSVLLDQQDRKAARAIELARSARTPRWSAAGSSPSDGSSSIISFGADKQPAPDRQHLLLAARQHRSRRMPPRGKVRKTLVDVIDLGVDRRHVAARERAHQQIFMHRQAHHDAAAFRHQRQIAAAPAGSAASG